jgi:hypothetical protein
MKTTEKWRRRTLAAVAALVLSYVSCGEKDSDGPKDEQTVAVTGVSLSEARATIGVFGDAPLVLAAYVVPENAANRRVAWESSAPGVAAVSNGAVSAVAVGTATITATTVDGGFVAACAVTVAGPGVYAAGHEVVGGKNVATLWVNGAPTRLGGQDSDANSVFVTADGDVYVAGAGGASYLRAATLWVNGAAATLGGPDSLPSSAESVFVTTAGDVCVAGREQAMHGDMVDDEATLWVNGAPTRLGNHVVIGGYAHSVFVSAAGDVYVAGSGRNWPSIRDRAALWKNDQETWLGGDRSEARSVFVSGDGDVYVAGHEDVDPSSNACTLTLWRNGVATSLGPAPLGFRPCSVHVSGGGDVYVAGTTHEQGAGAYATVWKNGAAARLGAGVDSAATSVFVSPAGDVYVAGAEDGIAIIWKNGAPHRLGAGAVNSVFLK